MRIYLDCCCLQRPFDLAMASCAQVDYFVTSDDKLIRKARKISGLKCNLAPLLGIVMEALK